ncbi:helix-turn-helix domain-containing protein [Roseovarius sp.]|uniref:helix-turn-helix domain-containing protein n=1 Tax=Roseovarius sp. TaxID=1486281 RepID=UPI003566AC63
MTDFKDFFSFDLKQCRLGHGLSRSDMAWLLGVSASTLRRWEDGQNIPQTATIWRVLNELERLPETEHAVGVHQLKIIFNELGPVDVQDSHLA